MARTINFPIRLSADERATLERLATEERRTGGDYMRLLLHQAAQKRPAQRPAESARA